MSRVKRGYIARRRRKKNRSLVSGFRGAHSRQTRMILQQKMRGLYYSHRDRGRKKRYFRRLWITRINAVTRENQIFNSYCKFIHNLYKKQFFLNRKILSQIAISNKIGLQKISDKINKYNKIDTKIIF
uniref:Large ribosomal subunit protein bL20c n=1 Tax=Eleocharis cellulosa TaxID=110283 RepID=A0A6H1XI10_9POAL|nr:ribosomal protein L20 [Eleocharis cellulosa]QJA15111.1 ribosomal protein L20 [Eleocharis cellulosa]